MSEQSPDTIEVYDASTNSYIKTPKVVKTDDQWKKALPPEQYEVTRHHGTEAPFTGEYVNNHHQGVYKCPCCGLDLFSSKDKFDSGTGWPSFTKPIDKDNIASTEDSSHFMRRIEVHCPRCGAHLGHVFDDGPAPTGQRFCMNGASMNFTPKTP